MHPQPVPNRTVKKRGSTPGKCDDHCIQTLSTVVDDNVDCSLVQLKMKTEVKVPSVTISTSSIDRLLSGHDCTRKKLFVQSAESNQLDVKEKRAAFTQWLTKEEAEKFLLYIDETNSRTWCSHSYGRSSGQSSVFSLFLLTRELTSTYWLADRLLDLYYEGHLRLTCSSMLWESQSNIILHSFTGELMRLILTWHIWYATYHRSPFFNPKKSSENSSSSTRTLFWKIKMRYQISPKESR